jgi:hypothetical protein
MAATAATMVQQTSQSAPGTVVSVALTDRPCRELEAMLASTAHELSMDQRRLDVATAAAALALARGRRLVCVVHRPPLRDFAAVTEQPVPGGGHRLYFVLDEEARRSSVTALATLSLPAQPLVGDVLTIYMDMLAAIGARQDFHLVIGEHGAWQAFERARSVAAQ